MQIPRYAPDIPFPSYSYVPGMYPHPVNNPEGHSYGVKPQIVDEPDPHRWYESPRYLYGIDLFNHGYYWEAHEVWEELWNACGRIGQTAMLLKGLIKLAAAGVKVREGVPMGVQKLSRGAAELFQELCFEIGSNPSHFMGLDLNEILRYARETTLNPPQLTDKRSDNPVVFSFQLILPRR